MKSWRNALVREHATLEQAIRALDKAALRIALVLDEQDKLIGTLTDGDVRRALLKHLSLDTPVVEVMNSNPKAVLQECPVNEILGLMEHHDLLQLPLLDNEGKVVGLTSLHELLNKSRYENPVFLMAGGYGTRLRPLTNSCPKPMLRVGGKPILEQIIGNFVEAGFYRFYISVHYMADVIRDYFGDGRKWGVSIKYVYEEKPLGTAGALGLLPHEEINLPMFMMNGDLLTSLSLHGLLEFHESHDSLATICVTEYQHQVPYGVVTSDGSRIKSMVEKPIHRFFVNAGIYLLAAEFVKSVKSGTRIDMPSLLEDEIAKNNDVNMFPIHEYWLDIGRLDDFNRAQADVDNLSYE